MVPRLACFFITAVFLNFAVAESLPVAPRRSDSLDQVSKDIFSSASGNDPKEGFDAVGIAATQAAPLKTTEVAKRDEKDQKLKQTPSNGKQKTPKEASYKKVPGSQRLPAAKRKKSKKSPQGK